MIEYFESKDIKDFKNNKLYWEFYSSSIKIRSCKVNEFLPSTMKYVEETNVTKTYSTRKRLAMLLMHFLLAFRPNLPEQVLKVIHLLIKLLLF
jgi:hypothetical protein